MYADNSFLQDAIDIHIHVGPDYMPRYGNSIRLAQEAANAGMKAIIIKGHLTSTVASAEAATQVVDGIKVFGGISLNEPSGELNPRAVMVAARSGGKMVWLPTVDSAYAISKAKQGHWISHYVDTSVFGYKRSGMSVLDENGALKESVLDILKICKDYDVILGTGHISPEESLKLARASKDMGYDKLEVTHPNAWLEDFTFEVMRELTSLGATLTLSYGVCSPQNGRQPVAEIAQIIREIGARHCCLITDYGQIASPSPVEGYRVFCQQLLNAGISKEDIGLMTKENPGRLLSI